METETPETLPAPRPRPFPCMGSPPGPRCGHTLTAINTTETDLGSAKLVLFGKPSIRILLFLASRIERKLVQYESTSCPHSHDPELLHIDHCDCFIKCNLLLLGGATALEGPKDGQPPASPGPASSTGYLPFTLTKSLSWLLYVMRSQINLTRLAPLSCLL